MARNEVAKKKFVDANGREHTSATDDWTVLRFDVTDGPSIEIARAEVEKWPVVAQLIGHGLSQKVGDAYSRAKVMAEKTGVTVPQWVAEQIESMIENLSSGQWVTVRESGGGVQRTGLWLQAAIEVLGDNATEENIAVVREALKSAETADAVKQNPKVRAVYARLVAERAAERAKQAAAAAEGAEGLDGLFG